MSLRQHAKATRNESFALQSVLSVMWAVLALTMSNLADGISVDPLAVMIFSVGIGILSTRMNSIASLSMFLLIVVLSANLVSSYQGLNVSSEQFFAPYWGPLDYFLVAMMWVSPIFAFWVRSRDLSIKQILGFVFHRAIALIFGVVKAPPFRAQFIQQLHVVALRDLAYRTSALRRGPPINLCL